MTDRYAVVGAGLAGPLMAINLGRLGFDVELFERRSDPRATGGGEGRSINLAISTRGIHALQEAGVADAVLAKAVPMRGRMIHGTSGSLAFQPYGTRAEHVINSVSRSGLNMILLDAADALPNVTLHFDQRMGDVRLDEPSFSVRDAGTGVAREVEPDVIVGGDGAFSAVRDQMSRLDRFDFSQSYLAHGYKELEIRPDNGRFRLEKHALHIWPRGGYMMIALPNHDGSFTCTLFWPLEGRNSFSKLKTSTDVDAFFRHHFRDAVPHLPDLADQYLKNPTSSLVTVRCGPWHHRDRAVLLGDACHAVVPFYGQGANAAFEDCSVLKACLERHTNDREAAFSAYYAMRKVHTDALADLAIENFVEMRDHVGSGSFRLRKKLEKIAHRVFGSRFQPLYSMVTFSRIPYADAVRKAQRQDKAMLLAGLGVFILVLVLGRALWN